MILLLVGCGRQALLGRGGGSIMQSSSCAWFLFLLTFVRMLGMGTSERLEGWMIDQIESDRKCRLGRNVLM